MFELKPLDKVIELIGGGTPRKSNPEFWGGDIPWLSVKDFGSVTRHVFDTELKITELGLAKSSTKILNPRDSIISARGTVGAVAQMAVPMAFNQSCYGVRAVEGESVPDFVFYLLKYSVSLLQSKSHGSVFSTITRETFSNLEVPVPNIETQKRISSVLATIDDKIESNYRVIERLPELISAKIQLAIDELELPRLESVSSLAQFVNGGAYTKGASGTGRMVVRIAELNNGPGASTVYNDIEVPEEKTVRAGEILMSWSGSLDVYRWFREEAIVNQHIFKVIPQGFPDWYVFDRLNAVIEVFQGIAKDKATTMGHIKRGDLDTTQVPMLSNERIAELDVELGAAWERLLMLEAECERLKKLRDALLPELISGRLAPEDIPALVNGAEVAHA